MIVTVIRTAVMYFFVVLALRVMGKRQIGELEPSELVVTIMISELASLPIQEPGHPLMTSIIGILLLLILEVVISFLAYKNMRLRKFFYGTPSLFFKKGKIDQKEMENQRFNLNDLLAEVRNSGAADLSEVDYVLMETNGNVSVILNAENRPLTPKDMNISPQATEISYVIIDNGRVNTANLKLLGYNEGWLRTQLKNYHLNSPAKVFYMGADNSGNVYLIPKKEKNEVQK